MKTEILKNKKWLKVGAAAFMSVTMLAACGDGEDDDVDLITPPEDVNENDGTESDVDVDMEVPNEDEQNQDTEQDPKQDTEQDSSK